jgi:hypothetical protein
MARFQVLTLIQRYTFRINIRGKSKSCRIKGNGHTRNDQQNKYILQQIKLFRKNLSSK